MNPALKIFQPQALDLIREDFKVEVLGNYFSFTEGPVQAKDGSFLFSDIPRNCIYRVEENREVSIYLDYSGTSLPDNPDINPDQCGSNALAFDEKGRLLVCQHGDHAIARYNHILEPFIYEYDGRPLNSPNDLAVNTDGRIYFSDPPYGLKEGKLNPDRYQPFAGVYCWDQGKLSLITDAYQYPNGVVLSRDEKLLYICSNKPFEAFVSVVDTTTNKVIATVAKENSDGIECDAAGNLYLCNKDGLLILDSSGARLALVTLPAIPSNLCWVGSDAKDLFITARQYVLLIKSFLK